MDNIENTKNQKLIEMYQYIISLGSIDKKDINQLYKRFNHCLEYCKINNIYISNMLVYKWLTLTKDDVYNIEHPNHGARWSDEHRDFIKDIKELCRLNREALGMSGEVNPVYTMFLQKVHDGYIEPKATQQIEVISVPQALNQNEIIKQFGLQSLEGDHNKSF